MTTLSIYLTHNKNIPLKTFPKRFSQLASSHQSSTLDLFVTALFRPEDQGITLIDRDARIQFDADDLLQSKQLDDFFIFIDTLKERYNVVDTILCIDANFGIPAHVEMTTQAIECINRLSPSYLTLFSNTQLCLNNALFWAIEHGYIDEERPSGVEAQAATPIQPSLQCKPLQVTVIEQAISSISSHLNLIEKSNSSSRSMSRHYSSVEDLQSMYGFFVETDSHDSQSTPSTQEFKTKFIAIPENEVISTDTNATKTDDSLSQSASKLAL